MAIDWINVFNSLLDDGVENEVKAVCHGKVSGELELLLTWWIIKANQKFPAGLFVPFKLPNANACVDSNLECPLKKNVSYEYSSSFPILKIYPKVDVEVKYELKNSEGKDIVCVLIPVKIQ